VEAAAVVHTSAVEGRILVGGRILVVARASAGEVRVFIPEARAFHHLGRVNLK
jgi:hypothetical protein